MEEPFANISNKKFTQALNKSFRCAELHFCSLKGISTHATHGKSFVGERIFQNPGITAIKSLKDAINVSEFKVEG